MDWRLHNLHGVKGAEDKFIDFLSPKWVEMLQHTLNEGKRLGLGIDMYRNRLALW
ncbi:MAG: hypothetical protein IPG86_21220 [Chitinophagaceae bacterium]|nr:hypothetical protein [Chitinophagaceae bacterium]